MRKVDLAKWNQTVDDLREAALTAPHARTRERFFALYALTQQDRGATAVARRLGRPAQTVIRWVHRTNAEGPRALDFVRAGSPLF